MARHVVLICGPPCAGKTTVARQLAAQHGGTIIDRDLIAQRLGSPHPWNHPRHITTAAEREFKTELTRIANTPDIRAYIVRSLPNPHERNALATRLGATIHLVDPGQDECIRRARADRRPRWTYGAITNWYTRAANPQPRATKPRPKPKLSTVHRGYGPRHRALRDTLTPHVATGTVRCWRCRELIQPGTPWDLGHDDHDRTQYRGPEHRRCNRSSAASKGNSQREHKASNRTSRDWLA